MNRSHVCTYSQFQKEFKPLYPEINYSIPKEVNDFFGDPIKVSDLCLVIPMNPVMKISEAAWLCHKDAKTILNTQIGLSQKIYDANMGRYEFVADNIQGSNTIVPGQMVLEKDKFTFSDSNKKIIVASEWKDVEPYSSALYLKEEINFKGDKNKKPDSQRCIKLFRKSELPKNNADYFCAIYHRNDVTSKLKMEPPQGRFAAEMYANKINIRLQIIAVKNSILELSKLKKNALEIDSGLLWPLKVEVRRLYFNDRHVIVNDLKLKLINKDQVPNMLNESKNNAIDKVCGGLEICKRALNFCIDKEILPLSGTREKFAMDCQNPYNHIVPKTGIQVDNIGNDSLGKAILTAVAQMKGTQCYFAEQKESSAGDVPNALALKKAWNTVNALKEKRQYNKFDEILKGCKADDKHSSRNIRRKVSFLGLSGENDVFFEYFGSIRDFQLTKK